MQGLIKLTIAITVTVTVIGSVGAFKEVNKLLSALHDLQSQTMESVKCFDQLHQLEAPVQRLSQFATNVSDLYQSLVDLQERCRNIEELSSSILSVPGVDAIGSAMLAPLKSSLSGLSRMVGMIEAGTAPIVESMLKLEGPVELVGLNAMAVPKLLAEVFVAASTGKQQVAEVAKDISMLECGNARFGLLENMESAASGMTMIPNNAKTELELADNACLGVKRFFIMLNARFSPRVEGGLLFASAEIDKISKKVETVEGFLIAVDHILNKTVCPGEIGDMLAEQLEMKADAIENIIDIISDKTEDIVEMAGDLLAMLGINGNSVRPSSHNETRAKREVCYTVREVLEGGLVSLIPNETIAQVLLKDVFSMALPQLPRVSRRLMFLVSTLKAFQIDFDLQTKADNMLPNTDVINNFLAIDYGKTFWERPAKDELFSERTCQGEDELVIPRQ